MNPGVLIVVAVLSSQSLFAEISQQSVKALAKDYDRGTYAAIDYALAPFAPALRKAEDLNGGKLNTRGEAHLTVLTPPEYMRLDPKLRKLLLADLKEALSKPGNEIKPLCIGKGQAEVQGKTESTYFVVVDAKAVQTIREKYHLLDYYPHVTLGFTKRDLHFEDGVKKDRSACVAGL
jgi:hypothetical protein